MDVSRFLVLYLSLVSGILTWWCIETVLLPRWSSVNAKRVVWRLFSDFVFFAVMFITLGGGLGLTYLLFQLNDIVGMMGAVVVISLSLTTFFAFLRYWLDYTDKKDDQYRQRTIRIEPVNLLNVKDPEAFRAAIEKIERTNGRAA